MKPITRKRLARRKQRIAYRLREIHGPAQRRPMLTARNIRYEVADRARGLAAGGIGAMHRVALRTGLVEAIDRNLHLLKRHLPY
ncbi:MAG: IS1380 family transposase, partial [Phycisphaerae bacterium]